MTEYDDPDFILDEMRDQSSCPNCGSPSPARIDGDGCSDCRQYLRCPICRRWLAPVVSMGMAQALAEHRIAAHGRGGQHV